MTQLVKQADPSRLVCSASGWDDKPVGDIIDMHKYVGPGELHKMLTHDMQWYNDIHAKASISP